MKYTLYVTENGGYMLSKKAKWYSATEWLGRFGIWWTQVDGVEYRHGVAKNKVPYDRDRISAGRPPL